MIMSEQTPEANNSVTHAAAGNLAFLLSVIRSGEKLSTDEEANIRRIIDQLTSETDQLAQVQRLVREHQAKQKYYQGFGSTAEQIKSIMREYEDKTIKALSDTKQFRDDMLVYFRALVLVLTMTGEAATHAEKAARLRGAIELLESAIENLRRKDLETLFSMWRWPDLFRSDWPTRRLMERIHDLQRELDDARKQSPATEMTEAF